MRLDRLPMFIWHPLMHATGRGMRWAYRQKKQTWITSAIRAVWRAL